MPGEVDAVVLGGRERVAHVHVLRRDVSDRAPSPREPMQHFLLGLHAVEPGVTGDDDRDLMSGA